MNRLGWSLFGIAIVWITSVAYAQSRAHVQPPLPQTPSAYLGFTNWDCAEPAPYAFVRILVDSTVLAGFTPDSQFVVTAAFIETVAHELKHVQQLRSLGCAGWHQRSEEVRDAFEAEAYLTSQLYLLSQKGMR